MNNRLSSKEIRDVIERMDKNLESHHFHRVKDLLLEGKTVALSIIRRHDDLVTLTDGILVYRPESLNVYVHYSDLEDLRARAEMMDL